MMAALFFNGSILLTLILIPLIYPEALPQQMMAMLLEAPPLPPAPQPQPEQQTTTQARRDVSEMQDGRIVAPPRIPPSIKMLSKVELPPGSPIIGLDPGQNGPEIANVFGGNDNQRPVVREDKKGPVRLPSTLVAGMLLQKTVPVYSPIAKAARVEGIVVLQAMISASGTIANLRVISGPTMLQQAALDAVSHWRYRPYLLNGQPVEVETTVNVIFTLSR